MSADIIDVGCSGCGRFPQLARQAYLADSEGLPLEWLSVDVTRGVMLGELVTVQRYVFCPECAAEPLWRLLK